MSQIYAGLLSKSKMFSYKANPRSEISIHCKAGLIWVSFEGDQEDYIVEAGKSLCLKRDGRMLVQSFADFSKLTVATCDSVTEKAG
jgi:hypothetical protein